VTLRFQTSVATDRGGYIEGQVITVTKPTPEHLDWLRHGIVSVVKGEDIERAVTIGAQDRAVSLPGRGRIRRPEALAGQHPRAPGQRSESDAG
jgi:hypothetical protein